MAITVHTSLEDKYTRHRGEALDDQGNVITNLSEKFRNWESAFEADHGQPPLGVAVPLSILPKRVRLKRGKKIFDYNGYIPGAVVVSKRLKDAVEDIEPGVHQFALVEILHKDGTPYGEPFWFFNICTCIDAINPELGGMKKNWYTAYPDEKPDAYLWGIARGRKNLAAYKDKVAGRAAWCDKRYFTGRFFSDALVSRMETEGMEGWVCDDFWQELEGKE